MDVKRLVRHGLVLFVIIFISFLLQTSVFTYIKLAGVYPNILVAVTATYGFMKGQKEGMFVGFACGLLLDLFLGYYFGIMCFTYMFIGFLNGFFRRLFFGEDMRLPMILIGTSDVVYGYIMLLINFAINRKTDVRYFTLNVILPEAVYTVLVALFVYYAILKVDQKLEMIDKKRGYGRLDGIN